MKIDLGCGRSKREGFTGVDILEFPEVDIVHDLRLVWPIEDGVVEEAHSSHFVEHLTGVERIHFFNELFRVMKPGGKATIITPDWSHACAYGDPTHQWPPMSGWYALYLNRKWREANAPHVPYTCDFDWTSAVSFDEWLHTRNDETKMFALAHYVNSARDLIVNLTKRVDG